MFKHTSKSYSKQKKNCFLQKIPTTLKFKQQLNISIFFQESH